MRNINILISLILATLIVYLPILINPNLLLSRANDLQEQFWPVFYFIQQQFLENQTLPLWNNLWFSGMPLLSDPQFSIFYPLHLIFLIFPTDFAFVVSLFMHTFLAGLGAYFLSKSGLGISSLASIFTAIIYISSPKLAGFLEAGHPGLVQSWTFSPFIFLSIIKITHRPKVAWSVLLGLSLAGTFYTHTIIFILSSISALSFFLINLTLFPAKRIRVKSVLFLLLAGLVTFGLIAITFLPQIEWAPHTTRFLLLKDRDVYPKWLGFEEFIIASLVPLLLGKEGIVSLDVEKWIPIGTGVSILATVGFLQLKRRLKILILVLSLFVVLISLNNASPLYTFLISFDWYVLARVTTRIWFVPVLLATLLAGYGFEALQKKQKIRGLLVLLVLFTIAELMILSWLRLSKPLPETKFVLKGVYEFLQDDREIFRVFCINRCLSQKESAKYGLELVEGYNTLQQIDYYKHMWQLSGAYWNYYTLSLPPTGTYTFESLKPDANQLGEFNTKYIISPYELSDVNLMLEQKIGNYFIYQNKLLHPRAYFWTDDQKPGIEAPILKYTPNRIRVSTEKHQTSSLVLAEIWSPGWKAFLNGTEETDILKRPNTLRMINIKPNTQFVEFIYEPNSFRLGRLITLITTSLLLIGLLIKLIQGFRTIK